MTGLLAKSSKNVRAEHASVFFKSFELMPSIPDDEETFKFLIRCSTPYKPTSTAFICGEVASTREGTPKEVHAK